jgi:hypothetical protein
LNSAASGFSTPVLLLVLVLVLLLLLQATTTRALTSGEHLQLCSPVLCCPFCIKSSLLYLHLLCSRALLHVLPCQLNTMSMC